MRSVVYAVIVFVATATGAITGLGGGVIIKPLFDLIGGNTAAAISFYSSISVFTMSIVSIYKQVKRGFEFDVKRLLSISGGSVVGGFLGESIFSMAASQFTNQTIKLIQSILLLLTLVFILIYTFNKQRFKHYQIRNYAASTMVGSFLGTISVFLGIGGGPLNVALLLILFSYTMKQAVIYSIATIFFSQVSKLLMVTVTGQLADFHLSIVPVLMITAIFGGYLGTCINQRLNDRKIERLYSLLMFFLLIITLINIVRN
ncbi:UPF0721 transmembrane protein [Enterococcus florum]|uniref:Probable membrane transporter protein n=1 Tax=Enterococcus florum TaxID=2480627 RepID=A0A4V0WPS2_9ENTE|nr:sulfite exporter TauE/SafE family protein [Enterococcus florum]GCF94849.1 UPF0721 transmembrane protein [Enterococcus florum]